MEKVDEVLMASTRTGEELISGHNNSANNTTAIIADKKSSGSPGLRWNNKNRVILLATATKDPNNRPTAKLDGIAGIANRGGAGVRGLGGQPEGPRGPTSGAGNGGDGVVGHGGTGDLEKAVGNPGSPGMGVLGIGGIWTGPAVAGKSSRTNQGGAGVVGVGGGDQAPGPWVPPFQDTKGVGVYGISEFAEGMVAQGKGAGLRASGEDWGVKATGKEGGIKAEGKVGVYAIGRDGPGGIFMRFPQPPPGKTFADAHAFYELGALPQIALAPQPMALPAPQNMQGDVKIIPPAGVDQLPAVAGAGELLLTLEPLKSQSVSGFEPAAEAVLWLCVTSTQFTGKERVPAVWKQVLLGPAINGTRENQPP